jgi:hypothetical protein
MNKREKELLHIVDVVSQVPEHITQGLKNNWHEDRWRIWINRTIYDANEAITQLKLLKKILKELEKNAV